MYPTPVELPSVWGGKGGFLYLLKTFRPEWITTQDYIFQGGLFPKKHNNCGIVKRDRSCFVSLPYLWMIWPNKVKHACHLFAVAQPS